MGIAITVGGSSFTRGTVTLFDDRNLQRNQRKEGLANEYFGLYSSCKLWLNMLQLRIYFWQR